MSRCLPSGQSLAVLCCPGAPANALARRFCARWLVIAGGLLAMAGFALSSLAANLWVFFFTYGVCIGESRFPIPNVLLKQRILMNTAIFSPNSMLYLSMVILAMTSFTTFDFVDSLSYFSSDLFYYLYALS